MSVRRVPPPPPPGFGDEEYYRLYGRPEDYHRYRAELERKAGRSRSRSSLESGEEVELESPERGRDRRFHHPPTA